MARTIIQIQQQIIERVKATPVLAAVLTSTSMVAIWLLWAEVVATVIWAHEMLFDAHKAEVKEIINEGKAHSTRWYAARAKDFQFGYQLDTEEDTYDNTGLTVEQIAASLIVAYSAVVEQDGGLRIKVARLLNGDLAPLDAPQLAAFTEYMARIKDAGVDLKIDSLPPDSLKLQLKVYYDPLVIGANGSRLDGTDNAPVVNTVNEYLKKLPFNGTLVLALLTDDLQAVPGVVIPHIAQAQARYGSLAYSVFDVKYSPDAGYLRVLQPTDLDIIYIAQTVIV